MMAAIELNNLTLRPDKQIIVEGLSLTLPHSSRTALLGASGSGKTSLLRAIAGFVRPEKGRVCLFGRDVTHVPPEDRGISMLFQDPVLFPRLTVRENARLAMGHGVDGGTANSRIESLARELQI